MLAPVMADPNPPVRILVVEDDPGMRMLILRVLQGDGFTVRGVQDGHEMWQALEGAPFDLVILDVMLPGANGLDLCRALRARSQVPVIMVSARGEELDRVLGLELGADDYVPKPFGQKELLARVRAVLRRAASRPGDGAAAAEPGSRREILRFEGWSLDLRRRELLDPAGVTVELSGAEHDLLASFLENPQRVIGRDRLLELSRTRLGDVSDRSVDVLVSRLRRKLGAESESLIRTVRGLGYIFTASVERS
ncbi:MAG: response regulator transcription factor [Gluconacetobacter diazotrophicus]|nr:response regulator transcription factor [Gluconacetobacter diazotrophicus]